MADSGQAEKRSVDLSGAARGVWLVKVPKYLSEKWKEAQGAGDVGRLRISRPRVAGGKPEVIFSLNEQLLGKDKTPVPKDHKFVLTGMASSAQTLTLLSQENIEQDDPMQETTGKLAIEGRVIQRAECRPIVDDNYMQLKRADLEKRNKPQREVIKLDRAEVNYKPKSYHVADLEANQRKKEEGKKSRLDKDHVMDLLFSAFEKHQYYNVKDLVRITQQPITYLKEILKEICLYNMKAPHKNMWELKPEYRHYKSKDGEGTSSTT